MALIPAGSFTMGNCKDPSEGWSDELPLHTVYASAFYMDKYDVTKALWDSVYQWATSHGYNFDYPGSGKAANHPVQTIDWYEAVKWCNARSEMEGRTPAYYTSAAQTTVYRTGEVDMGNSSVSLRNREAERPGAVEASEGRAKPDCGGQWVPENVCEFRHAEQKARAAVAIFGGARTFLSAWCDVVGRAKRTRMSALLSESV
jgi:hypothetical protein